MIEANGSKPRPPDLERFGSRGPQSFVEIVEQRLSNGDALTLKALAEEGDTTVKYASKKIGELRKENLVVSLLSPDDARVRLYRWKYFEVEQPLPKPPSRPAWHTADSKQMFIKGPVGHRTRLAYKWHRVRDHQVRLEQPNIPMGDLSDAELKILLEDLALNVGHIGKQMNSAPGYKRPATITGHELVMRVSTDGIDSGGMRNAIGQWMAAVADAKPEKLWLPECIILGRAGYRIQPQVVMGLQTATIKSLIPGGAWACPTEVAREFIVDAANIWRNRSVVG